MRRSSALAAASVALLATACAHHRAPPPARGTQDRPAHIASRTGPASAQAPNPFDRLEQRQEVDLGPEEHPSAAVDAALDAVIAKKEAPTAAVASAPWDKKSTPQYLDLVVERYGLTAAERALLFKNGMVVLSRVSFSSYGLAMHEIHRQELPLFVTADALLEAVFRSHEHVLAAAENEVAAHLATILEKVHTTLGKESARYDADVAKDADVFLGVARALLGADDPSLLGQKAEVSALAEKANGAERVEAVSLFGRKRMVDFSFYRPRGMYTDHRELHAYFRAMVWLTRLEQNLVSRGSQSSALTLTLDETPREATLALVLADLVDRAGVARDVAAIDAYQRTIAGPREDVGLAELSAIVKSKNPPLKSPAAAQAVLAAAIGKGHVRTVNHHVMPYGTSAGDLPVIATFFGVSITADTKSLSVLAPSSGPARVPRAPELAYLMGADGGARFLDPTGSPAALGAARRALERNLAGSDLHTTWTKLVLGATTTPTGTAPSFEKTSAADDRRVGLGVAGYAQIHHAHVLHTAQLYDFAGCKIPDAYVEPSDAFARAVDYTKRLAVFVDAIPGSSAETTAELRQGAARLAKTTTALATIVADEAAGRPLSSPQRALLEMVAEYIPASRGYASTRPGRYNGWYPRMHADPTLAFEKVPFSIDHFTSTRLSEIAFVGEAEPALGLFVVDVGGAPRVMVGPVARTYDRVRPLGDGRVLDDDRPPGSDERVTPTVVAPQIYERSYVAPSPKLPDFQAAATDDTVSVSSRQDLLGATFELVDPHGKTVAKATIAKVPASPDDHRKEVEATFVRVAPRSDGESLRIRLANGIVLEGTYRAYPGY